MTSSAAKPHLEIQFLGHAAFKIGYGDFCVMIDPWISNPLCPEELQDVKKHKADAILITHGHGDHIGEAVALLLSNPNAKLYSIVEVSTFIGSQTGVQRDQCVGMNKGGSCEIGKGFRITLVSASHSSGLPDGSYGGEACGVVIHTPDNHDIYHTGDTDVFSDMKIINDIYKPDLALMCIGGHYTMDHIGAFYALQHFLTNVKKVIPMHYKTFPALKGSPITLAETIARACLDVRVHEIQPGFSFFY